MGKNALRNSLFSCPTIFPVTCLLKNQKCWNAKVFMLNSVTEFKIKSSNYEMRHLILMECSTQKMQALNLWSKEGQFFARGRITVWKFRNFLSIRFYVKSILTFLKRHNWFYLPEICVAGKQNSLHTVRIKMWKSVHILTDL